ncbi:MAG: membrane-anchored protein [Phyllobacterium sp.]
MNGSQDIARKWGIDKPHVTFMQYNQIEGTNTNAVAVRSVLNGKNTGRLYVLLWRDGLDKLKRGLSAFDYTCDHLQIVSRYERIALHHSVMRSWNFEDDIDMRFSNGVTAVLYAIQSGAKTVIISGINPNSTGHAYNDANLPRSHVDRDRDILMKIHENGFPLFTADPTVAKTLGLPLWTREAADCLNVTGTK